jgi:hypothetical protein
MIMSRSGGAVTMTLTELELLVLGMALTYQAELTLDEVGVVHPELDRQQAAVTLGVSQQMVEDMRAVTDPLVARYSGVTEDRGLTYIKSRNQRKADRRKRRRG